MLQPRDIFSSYPKKDVPILCLPSHPNVKFWVVPTKEYADLLEKQINKAFAKSPAKRKYLNLLVGYASGDKVVKPNVLLTALKDSKLSAAEVSKDFGELLAPFYGLRYLDKFMSKDGVKVQKGTIRHAYGEPGKKLNSICFPDAQNYPIFDFFVQNGYYFGFSVKAMTGGSNTLSPTYIAQRVKKLKEPAQKQLKKDYPVEFAVLSTLAEEKSFAGPTIAFGEILKTRGDHFANIFKIRSIFENTDFEKDAKIIEKNKDKPLSSLKLSDRIAYNKFMNDYIIDATKQDDKDKQKYKSGKKEYTPENLVYAFIKYLAMIDYDVKPMLRELFPDLNIIKVEIDNKGVPNFKMVTIIEAKDTVLQESFDLRSKAAFNRVNDKLGIQL
jgi:hypothetical protein